jgi:hypothetical protein
MSQFNMIDTKRADGCYIRFKRIETRDDNSEAPDERDEGFWPSLDKDAAGWIGDNPEVSFEEQERKANERMIAWERDEWYYIGIQARAHVTVVCNGTGTMLQFDSPGLWGIESDSGPEYINEVFQEECEKLKEIIKAFANPIYEV